MATYIKTMKDINGNTVLPKTNIKAIYDDSGNRLDGILNGSQLPSFTPNLSFSDTIPMHQNGSNVKIRLDDFLMRAGAPYGGISGMGSNSNGGYTQFADGTMMCWGNVTLTGSGTAGAWGSLYYGETYGLVFPASFYSNPAVTASLTGASETFVVIPQVDSYGFTIYGVRPAGFVVGNYSVRFLAVGRWRA